LAEDEKREYDFQQAKFDLLLQFIDSEGFGHYKDWREGKVRAPGREVNAGTTESTDFCREVEELPAKRMSKPPLKEDYVAKRMKELMPRMERAQFDLGPVAPIMPGEKQFTYERKVVIRGKESV